jgi:2'-5' RNA ligase
VGRLHVSLAGVPSPDLIPTASAAAGAVRARPFKVAFNRLGTWGRGDGVRPIVLWGDEGVIGIERLHAVLEAALRRAPPHAICPHMTLARDAAALPERIVGPITWWARDFVLVRSGGGRTEVLGRWPLTPAA